MGKKTPAITQRDREKLMRSLHIPVLHEDFLNEFQNARRVLRKELEKLGLDWSSEPDIPILRVEYLSILVRSVLLYTALHKLRLNSPQEVKEFGLDQIDDELENRLDMAEFFFHLELEHILSEAVTMLIDFSLLYANDKPINQKMIKPIVERFLQNTIYLWMPKRQRGGKESATSVIKREMFQKRFKEVYPIWREAKKAYNRIKRRVLKRKPYRGKNEREATAEYIELLKKEVSGAANLPSDLLAKLHIAYEGEPKRLALLHTAKELGMSRYKYSTLEAFLKKAQTPHLSNQS
jgi:hypothetical protein